MKIFQHSIILGFSLFALYFGAGNLLFPPLIGYLTGTEWVPALIGFTVTGIVLPLLAIIAILNAGGSFEELTKPISPWFYAVFNLLLMGGIVMIVTIPRMAATTHELGIGILFPQTPSFVTIALFFAISFYFALDKSNVIEIIGKYMTPILVIILLFIIGKGFFAPIGTPISTGVKAPFADAFLSGYQTVDIVTGILCAPIFITAIIGFGYKGEQVRKVALSGTMIAGSCLLVVYGGLLFIGASGSGIFPVGIESTELVSQIVSQLLGRYGSVALAVAIALACLTTAIGVMAVVADFLNKFSKNKVSYRNWVLIICLIGTGIGSLGVDRIVDYTMPILTVLYPVSIVLVFLGIFRKYIPNAGCYQGSILMTFIVSFFETMNSIGVNIPFANGLINLLPLSSIGLAWVMPALIGFVGGLIIHKIVRPKTVSKSILVE